MKLNFDFDNLDQMHGIDRDDMLSHVDALAQQFEDAWHHAQTLPLPADYADVRQIVLCGMGGSAIGGDLTAALVSATSPASFSVQRGYELPAYVNGPDTLVIASSNSGNTEETLAATEQALARGTKLLAVTTGGKLAAHAAAHAYPLWQFSYASPPRAALGWSFGILIGLASRLKLATTLEADMQEALVVLREYQPRYAVTTPTADNPAKQWAAQLTGRVPTVYGSGVFEPIARRWKGQFNENAKTWAGFEAMPEANHNAVCGIVHPADEMPTMAVLFVHSPQLDHPRVALRYQYTRAIYEQHGILVNTFEPQGTSVLAQMCHAIQFGDYVSYYSAMAYEADPTEIAPIIELKSRLAAHAAMGTN